MYTWIQRLRSLRHRFSLGLGERMRSSRGAFVEIPAGRLFDGPREQSERIAALRAAYQVQFEAHMSAPTARNNYEYLDVLTQLWQAAALAPRRGGALHDVGCASFWYAAALDTFFAPSALLGIDVEGYRRFKDGHSRADYAAGYLRKLPHARFAIADYNAIEGSANVITAWFPFVTADAILAWRLPLSLLAPQQLFCRIRHNLAPGGIFIMINHGFKEADAASRACAAAGLHVTGQHAASGPLVAHRPLPAVASCWVAD